MAWCKDHVEPVFAFFGYLIRRHRQNDVDTWLVGEVHRAKGNQIALESARRLGPELERIATFDSAAILSIKSFSKMFIYMSIKFRRTA
jgi:hypothetical protein